MAPLPSQLLNVRFAYIPANILKRTRVRQKVAKATYSTQNTTSETTNPFGPVVPIFQHAEKFPNRLALRDRFGDYTFQGLYRSSHQFAKQISDSLNGKTQERVAFLCHNDASYVIAQWACWMSGQIAVPITSHHPPALQEYYINNSEASILVTTPDFVDDVRSLANKTNSKVIVLEDELCSEASKHNEPNQQLPQITLEPSFYQDSDALMIYTSGTTGNPKGVVITHSNLHAQVSCLIEAWGWTENDSILHVLPLHHIHGIVNVLLCSLASGARCVMLPRFDAPEVWNHLLRDNVSKNAEINMFMAVPTIYVKLLEEYDKMVASDPGVQERVLNTCSEKIRLMVSGSAPLPVPLFRRWEQVSGHKLLERFGMSETGMVISNPLNGKRKPGFVGNPLPGMEVQIVRQDNNNTYEVLVHGSSKGTTVLSNETTSGDLMVRGPNVFRGYWKMPEATKKEFTEDGWFKTGDSAQYIEGAYKIQGRTSVDIIKTGGYKVSALEIETHLLGHPDILDCAVIGLPDPTWGQKVAVVIVTRGGKNMTLVQLREWGKRRMAPYAVPTTVKVVETIPKNAMGKVNKKELIKAVFPDALKT